MANQDDVKITVSVDATGAIRAFDSLGKEIDIVKDKGKRAEGGFTSFQANLVSMQAAIGVTKEAFAAFKFISSEVIKVLSEGSKIANVENAFDRLSKSAGTTASVFLNDLHVATKNTITDFELMRSANQALNAGVKPDAFILLNKAASQFAREGATEVRDELNELVASYESGSDRALAFKGIFIDNASAIKKVADAMGVDKDKVNDLGKVEAMRIAILEKLLEKTNQTSSATLSAGGIIKQVSTIWGNFTEELEKQIATDAGVQESLGQIKSGLENINWKSAAEDAKEFIKVLDEVFLEAGDFSRGLLRVGQFSFSNVFKDVGNAAIKGLTGLGSGDEHLKLPDAIAKEWARVVSEVNKAEEAFGGFGRAEGLANNLGKEGTATTNAQATAEEQRRKVMASINEMLKNLSENSKKYITDAKASTKDLITANKDLESGYKDIEDQLVAGLITKDQEAIALQALEKAYLQTGRSAQELAIAEAAIKKNLEENSPAYKQALEDLKKYQQIAGEIIAGGLQLALDKSAKGADWKKFAGEIGGQIGQALGSATGIPGLDAIGEVLGDELGKVIFDAFGGKDSGGTKARKELDKYFADLFDGDRLSVVINGRLTKISDLVFNPRKGKGMFGSLAGAAIGTITEPLGMAVGAKIAQAIQDGLTKTGSGLNIGEVGWDAAFQGLPEASRRAFEGVGLGFTEMLGQMDNFGENLAGVLVNNIGGSLNNLQLLLEATGKSAEELSDAIIKAWEDGKISALEAQSALIGVQTVMQKGIPDAVGAYDQAFQNLMASTTKGGRVSADALGDIFAEAKELNLKSIDETLAALRAKYPQQVEEINKIGKALTDNGFTQVNQIIEATDKQLLPVLSELEALQFPFAKAADDLNILIDKVKQLPEQIKTSIVVDIQTTGATNLAPMLGINNSTTAGATAGAGR